MGWGLFGFRPICSCKYYQKLKNGDKRTYERNFKKKQTTEGQKGLTKGYNCSLNLSRRETCF